jgi:predicted NodU family carbamoyl transferase
MPFPAWARPLLWEQGFNDGPWFISQVMSAHVHSRAWAAQILKWLLCKRPRPGLVWDRLKNSTRVRDVAGALSLEWGVKREAIVPKLHWVEHHPAHLASAFFVSPFEEAAVCAIDRVCENSLRPSVWWDQRASVHLKILRVSN